MMPSFSLRHAARDLVRHLPRGQVETPTRSPGVGSQFFEGQLWT